MAYQWWHEPEFKEQSDEITAVINNYAIQIQKTGGAFLNSGKTNGGEVYTPYWTVVKMCYLAAEIDDLNKTVFDACCGSGNFILEVYRRRFIVAAHSINVYENIKNIVRNSFALDINSNSIDKARQRIITLFNNITTCFVQHNLLTERQKNELNTYITESIQYRVLTDSIYNIPCKFDVIISNPPYNKDMYLDFVEAAYDLLAPDGVGIFITPAKFYAKGGAKNEAFRQKIMPHIHNVHLYKCCTDVFDIAELGGVAYYSIYKNQTFDTKEIYNHSKNASLDDTRLHTHTHAEKPVEFMQNSSLALINKLKTISQHSIFENIHLSRSYYSNETARGHEKRFDDDIILMRGNGGTLGSDGYISRSEIRTLDNIDKYKVIMNHQQTGMVTLDKNNMSGGIKVAQYIRPGEAVASYIILSFADTELEAQSKVSYFNSQLVSYCSIVSFVGNGTDNSENWRHVPALPAGYTFDHIYTNEEIFDIFQLTPDERKLITSIIKPRAKKGI